MSIHGIVSTYFGDYEYDIGKSITWTNWFCDDVYIMDINTSEASRNFVVNWSYTFPNAKHSFYSKPFFGSPTKAANWRKESFNRAKNAWSYSNDDWVLFIDGTENLSVYHKPPVSLSITDASMTMDPPPEDPPEGYVGGGVITFTTDGDHDAVTGNNIEIQFANLPGSSEIYNLDGKYEIVDVPSSTTFSVHKAVVYEDVPTTALVTSLVAPATAYITTEPPGYIDNDLFQSWINYEIDNAETAEKDLISLDGWALIRSQPPSVTPYTTVSAGFPPSTWDLTKSEKYYVPMERLVRLVKVSALSDTGFDWTVLDQPSVSFPDAYDADNLSLISYAYCRWADSPNKMTQVADPDAPNYVAGDYSEPYLTPVLRVDDIGYTCRQAISTVRPLTGLPVLEEDWDVLDDPLGSMAVQPLADDGNLKLETELVTFKGFVGGSLVDVDYRKYGGTPAYVSVFRNNLREGLWYTSMGAPPRTTGISSISVAGGVAVATTTKTHTIPVGSTVVVYGTDAVFDGEYVVSSVSSTSFSFQMVISESPYTYTDTYGSAYAVTKPPMFGPVPWNYSTNMVSIPNVSTYIRTGVYNSLKK